MSDQKAFLLYHNLPAELKQEVLDFMAFVMLKRTPQTITLESKPAKRNALDSLKGKVWMAPDFDEPLEDFKEYM